MQFCNFLLLLTKLQKQHSRRLLLIKNCVSYNVMIQKVSNQQGQGNHLSHRQTPPFNYNNKEQASLRINWITKRDSFNNEKALRENNHIIKNINTGVFNSSLPLKALPHKEIDLLLQNNTIGNKQNQPLSRITSKASSEINSRKGSEQKKQKLSVISKRNSLRKITDFISFAQKEVKVDNKQNEFKLEQLKSQFNFWDNSLKIPEKVESDLLFQKVDKKKKIRISLKRQVDKNIK